MMLTHGTVHPTITAGNQAPLQAAFKAEPTHTSSGYCHFREAVMRRGVALMTLFPGGRRGLCGGSPAALNEPLSLTLV